MKVKVVEVGARDGLQNEDTPLDLKTRWQFIQKLSNTGLQHIEVGAFVSPKWVPQMAGSDKLVKKALKAKADKKVKDSVKYSALVPNVRGMEDALKTGIKEIAIFGASSESFSKKNINCSIVESFERFEKVMSLAKKNKVRVRGYLSTAFGCPYEGKVKRKNVYPLIQKMLELGVYEVSIGDTIGVATPKQVNEFLKGLQGKVDFKKIAMHFHDTRGTALANVYASLNYGIKTYDSSIGGLGGCPYAVGASGNLATEDLIYMLEGMGIKTGVDIQSLIEIKRWIEKKLDRSLPSHVGRSGLPLKNTI